MNVRTLISKLQSLESSMLDTEISIIASHTEYGGDEDLIGNSVAVEYRITDVYVEKSKVCLSTWNVGYI